MYSCKWSQQVPTMVQNSVENAEQDTEEYAYPDMGPRKKDQIGL